MQQKIETEKTKPQKTDNKINVAPEVHPEQRIYNLYNRLKALTWSEVEYWLRLERIALNLHSSHQSYPFLQDSTRIANPRIAMHNKKKWKLHLNLLSGWKKKNEVAKLMKITIRGYLWD